MNYPTVVIGGRTWMAKNLNYVPEGSSSASGRCYDDDAALCAEYGRLYDWATAMGHNSSCNSHSCAGLEPPRGICPSGWHIPSRADWAALAERDGGSLYVGEHLKSKTLWNYYKGVSGNGTDKYNFSALPGGYYGTGFDGINDDGFWWSAEEGNLNTKAEAWSLHSRDDVLKYDLKDKSDLFSVRCIKD